MNQEKEQSVGHIEVPRTPDIRKNAPERLHGSALASESYEEATLALGELDSLRDFREKTTRFNFSSFHELIEGVTNLNKLPLSEDERIEQKDVLIQTMLDRVQGFSPRVADLYSAILAEIQGEKYETEFEITGEKIAELKQTGDFSILFDREVSWDMKLNRIETRIIGYLAGARALDKREGQEMTDDIRQWREEELKNSPMRPPAKKNESKPGVDPMERLKEGERAAAIWSINPAWGGYYKEQVFHRWDSQRNTWVEDEYSYTKAEPVPLTGNKDPKKRPADMVMRGTVDCGQLIPLPIPYTHDLHKIEAGGGKCEILQDQNGDLAVMVEGASGESDEISVSLAPNPVKKFTSKNPEKVAVPVIPAEFSEETKNKLAEIAEKTRGNIARARKIRRYVLTRIRYLAPKDRAESQYYNAIYNNSPKGFAGAVDEIKKGDCDVVNTYFAALCATLDVPVRHVIGHSVKGKDENGFSSIHSGTGHGWSEVWDEVRREWVRIWVRMDATPVGDPNLEKEEKADSESAAPGDYGAQEAIRPSDEELDALRKKLAEHKEKLSYTREERQLAEDAGVELKEARRIVLEIKEAESARLSNGELAVDVMARLWDAIGESRKRELPAYSGPVRRREGGENISDIVRHYIGAQAGETDPMSREQSATEIKEEKMLGGMDVYVVGDKSGSMQSIADGEELWKLQRRFEYMLFSSLYRFNRDLEKAHLPGDKLLDVRTMAISFRGGNIEDVDLDKPLSPRFTAEDKVKMWRSLSEAGSGNGDVTAIQYIYQKIKEEKEEMARQGIEDNRLRVVVAYSDGGYVGAEAQMRDWAEEIAKLGAVAVGIGLTQSAASVPAVMHNPPKSFGEVVSNLDELTAATAKHIVLHAIKLFPEKARKNAEKLIEETLHKFGATK